jgi:hypothetical protein
MWRSFFTSLLTACILPTRLLASLTSSNLEEAIISFKGIVSRKFDMLLLVPLDR